MLDRDPRFTSKFWRSLQQTVSTNLNFSTAFHLQIDRQTKRTIQVLEDMLRAYIIDVRGIWEEMLSLIEFAYNNSYHTSIGMTPYEALYGKPYMSLVCWYEVGKRQLVGPELVKETTEKVAVIR